jgi:hypothetical protein
VAGEIRVMRPAGREAAIEVMEGVRVVVEFKVSLRDAAGIVEGVAAVVSVFDPDAVLDSADTLADPTVEGLEGVVLATAVVGVGVDDNTANG